MRIKVNNDSFNNIWFSDLVYIRCIRSDSFIYNVLRGDVMKTPQEIYSEAHSAGMAAGHGCTPTPMVVGTPTTPLGDDIDYSKDTYYVADGMCGFAWINIKPARGKFVTWMKKNNIGRTDSYYGGYTVWVSEFGQSVARKENYARAFAKVLEDNGITAYSMSRLD